MAFRTLISAGIAACALLGLTGVARAETAPLQALVGADSDLRLSGSMRLRYERVTGQPRVGLNPTDELLALRTVLTAEYRAGPVQVVGEVEDSRAWLGRPGSAVGANDVNTLEPIRAFVALDLPGLLGKGSKVSLAAGRMTLGLGSRRFVASNDYRNTTNAVTGLRTDLKGAGGMAATLFYVLPQVRLPADQASVLANRSELDRESGALRLLGGLVSRPHTLAGGAVELGYYRLLEHDRPGRATRDRDLHTFSARLVREPQAGRIDFDVEGAWQSGHVSADSAATSARLPVDAGMVHAALGYSFAGAARLRLALGGDWVSGDRAGGTYTRFDTLFGARRFEFSPSGIYAPVGRANILAPWLRLEAAPGKRVEAMALYRPLWLANRHDAFSTSGVADASGASGRFAGHQIDSRLRYWLVPARLRAEVNYDFLAKGRFLTSAPNAPRTGDAHYVSVGVTASF
ncbi:alginate export family protein [Novosphingobium flavum]|uniref:Alginate export family protein n=1 Tax=Novosphingobium flavum TaxID=1778672 RepID=A0A7X1FUE1_9SPHN|nr:alginate export family protein [Novosphingobium flavum]MBC2666602.1 alginate export family protein [Novosphingobium flavum]